MQLCSHFPQSTFYSKYGQKFSICLQAYSQGDKLTLVFLCRLLASINFVVVFLQYINQQLKKIQQSHWLVCHLETVSRLCKRVLWVAAVHTKSCDCTADLTSAAVRALVASHCIYLSIPVWWTEVQKPDSFFFFFFLHEGEKSDYPWDKMPIWPLKWSMLSQTSPASDKYHRSWLYLSAVSPDIWQPPTC